MKWVSYRTSTGGAGWGGVRGGQIIPLHERTPYGTLFEFISAGIDARDEVIGTVAALDAGEDALGIDDVELLPPYRPTKNIMCVGKNYRDHAMEMEGEVPKFPVVFTKSPTSVTAHRQPIVLDAQVTQQLDYEGELLVVIGKRGKAIPREDALQYIWGYSILNDVTARDLQSRHVQYFIGKSQDTFAPFGPWIVDAADVPDPQDVAIVTKVNGEIRQNGHTKDMIFPVDELIAVLSRGMTLEPGDMIATGTPSGVGHGFKPPKHLSKGDSVDIEINQIGVLSNPVQ